MCRQAGLNVYYALQLANFKRLGNTLETVFACHSLVTRN